MTFEPGSCVGPYDIVSLLGSGGFGEVYKARDTRLDRTVAIKILPSADPELRARFAREARAIASLQHPHICTLFDVGNHDGTDYLVMEYLEGETLAARIARGALSREEALNVAVEIAEALDKAHRAGIVHRDLKPANILITGGGAKLLDFGLAKLRPGLPSGGGSFSAALTTSTPPISARGTILGTLHYMAPEQLEGKEADARSDLWAFGSVLYEMLTGTRLFDLPRGRKISLSPRRASLVVRRCVEANPRDRWNSMAEVCAVLRPRSRVKAIWKWSAAALVLLAVLAAVAMRARSWFRPVVPIGQPRTLLVADFRNLTNDPLFDGVIDRAVAVGLEASPLINVYSRRDAMAIAAQIGHSAMLDDTAARLVARREGVPMFVTGAIARGIGGYDMSAELLDSVSGSAIALVTEKAVTKPRVLDVVARLTERLRAAAGESVVAGGDDLARETFTTSSLDAAKAYTMAQDLAASANYAEAIPLYQEAVRIDPEFGRAYAGWALSFDKIGRSNEAEELFQKAIALLARMNRRERLRTEGLYAFHERDSARAQQIYRTLVTEYPADATGWNNLAVSDFMLGRFSDAAEQGRRAVALAPNYVLARTNLALYAMYAGQFDSAVEEAHATLRLNDKAAKAYVPLAVAAAVNRRYEEAEGWYLAMGRGGGQGGWLAEVSLADLDVVQGRARDAEQRLLRRVSEDQRMHNSVAVAQEYSLLAEIAAQAGKRADVARFVSAGRRVSSDPQFTYRFANAFLDVGSPNDVKSLLADLAQTAETKGGLYRKSLQSEITALETGATDNLLQAATQIGTWWAYYRAAVVLSRRHAVEANPAWRWCLDHRSQGVSAFLDDVPTLRYYSAVAALK
jgi:eukaryotic-like serine/threonine-protein kinase